MIKKRTYLYMLPVMVCLCAAVALLAGCTDDPVWDNAGEENKNNGKIAMNVMLPGVYTQTSPSRAVDHGGLLDTTLIHTLPEGSTLRLFLSDTKPGTDGSYPSGANVEQYTFVVRVQYNNQEKKYYHTLSPCDLKMNADSTELVLDSDGLPQVDKEYLDPYYLPSWEKNGNKVTQFYFMAVSPAFIPKDTTVSDKRFFKYTVRNREDLLTTNNHWNQTKYTTYSNTDTETDLYANIELNPLMYNTARIRIFVTNETSEADQNNSIYANINTIRPAADCVELDRIPTNPGEQWTEYTWSGSALNGKTYTMPLYNLTLGDTIVRQMGNNINHNQLHITSDECLQKVVENALFVGTGVDQVTGVKDSIAFIDKVTLDAETHILPVDIRPTPMFIRLRVIVDETPMTFQYSTMRYFRAGYTYDYTVRLRIKDGSIYIATWQDRNWSYDLKYDVDPDTTVSATLYKPVETIGEIMKISNDYDED